MKKIKIHGKEYIMVKDRVAHFNKNYPNGSIRTELIEMTDRFIIKTTVVPDMENAGRYFTGHAEEVIGSSQINKTSALENAETSSIGRALASMGIGIDDSFASANEVENAQHQQSHYYQKTDNDKTLFSDYLEHQYFDGKRLDVKKRWKNLSTEREVNNMLLQMNDRIKKYEQAGETVQESIEGIS